MEKYSKFTDEYKDYKFLLNNIIAIESALLRAQQFNNIIYVKKIAYDLGKHYAFKLYVEYQYNNIKKAIKLQDYGIIFITLCLFIIFDIYVIGINIILFYHVGLLEKELTYRKFMLKGLLSMYAKEVKDGTSSKR